METLMIAPPPRPGAPPPAPPVNVAGMPLGFDIATGNGPAQNDPHRPLTVADFRALKPVGKIFGIHKLAQFVEDPEFDFRYAATREAGLIRGSYDFFAPVALNTQTGWVVSHVHRLTPGDLAPAIDIEDEHKFLDGKYHYSAGVPAAGGKPPKSALACLQDLFNDLMAWANSIEQQLGRSPMFYVGSFWREKFSPPGFPNLPDMNVYPLWTVQPNWLDVSPALRAQLQPGWSDWDIWQYSEDQRGPHKPGDPSRRWGVDPYVEQGTELFDGMDYDAYNGTMWGLRGLADIGRPGVALDGNTPYIAHSEIDGHIHFLARTGAWADSNLTSGNLAAGGEDPVLVASGGSLFLYFRSEGHLIEATLGAGNAIHWAANQIEESTLVHDPRVVFDGNKRYAVYWGDDDDWHLMTFDGGKWAGSGRILQAANLDISTGQPAVYVTGGVPHIVGRVGRGGDLMDVWQEAGNWRHDNVSALARAINPALPAATYSPCAYENSGGVGIAFRGLGGNLWLINRHDNSSTDLTATTGAELATGHPSCFVYKDQPHIVFRAADKLIHEIWFEGGGWHLQPVCGATTAAGDPVVTANGTLALVGFRASDGRIFQSQFDGTGWKCGPTAAVVATGPPTPTPIATAPTPPPTPTPTPIATAPTPTPTPTPIASGPTPTPGSGDMGTPAFFPAAAAEYRSAGPRPGAPLRSGAAGSATAPRPSESNATAVVSVVGLAALVGMVAAAAVVAIVAIAKDE